MAFQEITSYVLAPYYSIDESKHFQVKQRRNITNLVNTTP